MTNPPMPPISTTGTDRFSKILFWVGILIIPTILIIQVLVYQPFFAHFDDQRKLALLDIDLSLWQTLISLLWENPGNSYGYYGAVASSELFLTPIYFLSASFGSVTGYILNVVFVFFCIALFIAGIVQLLAPSQLQRTLLAGISASFLWPFTYELIFFPSLHEKGVVLAAGLILALMNMRQTLTNSYYFALIAILMVLVSLTTKSPVSVFMPALLLILILTWHTSLNYKNNFWVLFILVASFVIPISGTFIGGYSSTARSGTIRLNLLLPYAALILGIVVVYGVYVGVRFLRGSRNYLELVPLVMMATFWASIVYFGYRNYFLSIFGVMFGSAVAVVVGNLKSVKLQQLATLGLIVVTVGWTLYRIPQVFEPLHGIGAFTQGQIAKDLADEGAVIYTSCVEGSGHFNYYTERKWGVTPEFRPLEGDAAGYRFGIPDDGQYVFGDRRLCAAPGEMAEWDVVWASPGDDGFRLYKRPA